MTIYPAETQKKEPVPQSDVIIRVDRAGKKYLLPAVPGGGANDYWALKGVSFEVQRGQIFGIIGRNGAGKTTLLNMIAGVLSPTEGEVSVRGRVLGLFNLGVGFQDELTGRENIFLNGAILGASRKELESKFSAIIEFSELGEFIDMPIGTYSQGMRLRLGFSIVANLDFDVLVIDEVLAVGDAVFQSKCFERLMDFRRAGKTLILTTQSMEMIERLCDQAMLLDHGRRIFLGVPAEAISKYRALMDAEKFYVGAGKGSGRIFENTKKWTNDVSEWGQKLGTRESMITSVKFLNRWGFPCRAVKSRQSLKVRVCFHARNVIKEPHFGIAIFNARGVYVYGPNTLFGERVIREIKPGRGWFELHYEELCLAPGDYKISVAIWDKHETLPFDYHNGFYDLKISGAFHEGQGILNIPCKVNGKSGKFELWTPAFMKENDPAGQEACDEGPLKIGPVCWTDGAGVPKDIFRTREPARLKMNVHNVAGSRKDVYAWAGLFREDNIFCQGFAASLKGSRGLEVFFPELPLLPGGYKISAGIWDPESRKFLIFRRGAALFRMVFDREDHGTVHLKHTWKWELPK